MIWSTMRTAFQEAWTNRGSFWFQVTIMIVNDLAFVSFWFLLLAEVGEIRGWDVDQIMLLFAILATVTGISMGLLANTRFLGDLIADGALDAVLPLPVDPLAYLVVRRIDTALLGDLLFGPALFVIFGDPTIETAAVFLLASLCGAAVFTSFLVVLNSLTFFGVGRGEPAEIGFQRSSYSRAIRSRSSADSPSYWSSRPSRPPSSPGFRPTSSAGSSGTEPRC